MDFEKAICTKCKSKNLNITAYTEVSPKVEVVDVYGRFMRYANTITYDKMMHDITCLDCGHKEKIIEEIR